MLPITLWFSNDCENKENYYLENQNDLSKTTMNNRSPVKDKNVKNPLKPQNTIGTGTGVYVNSRFLDQLLQVEKDRGYLENTKAINGKKRERATYQSPHTISHSLDKTVMGIALVHIMENLRPKELMRIATVCHMFNSTIKHPFVVAAVFNRRCIHINPKQLPSIVNSCGQYIENFNLTSLFFIRQLFVSPQIHLDKINLSEILNKCPNLKKVDLAGFILKNNIFSTIRKIGTDPNSSLNYVRLTETDYISSKPETYVDIIWPALKEIVFEQASNKNNHLFNKWAISCVNLTTLRFPFSNFEDATLRTIATQFSKLRNLEITEGKFNFGIIAIGEKCKNLHTLILRTNFISLDTFQLFTDACKDKSSLVELDIFSSNIFLIEDIIDCISKLTSLRKLNTNAAFNYKMDQEKSSKIQSSLTYLGLLDTFFSPSFEEIVSKAFPNIQSLDLANGRSLDSPSINAIPKCWPNVHTLNLQNNVDFFRNISTIYPALTSLNIDRCTGLTQTFFESMPNIFPRLRELSMQAPSDNLSFGSRPSEYIIPLYDVCRLVSILPNLISCIPPSPEADQILIKRGNVPERELEYSFRYGDKGYQPEFW